jgi:hypothetical protein
MCPKTLNNSEQFINQSLFLADVKDLDITFTQQRKPGISISIYNNTS